MKLTAKEIYNRGLWEQFCDWNGIPLCALQDGLISDNKVFEFSNSDMINIFGLGKPKLLRINGKVEYFKNWCVAWLPKTFRNYYKLIPKWKNAQPQKYDPHITIVRKNIEQVKQKKMSQWGTWDGLPVKISYDPRIRFNDKYYWMDAWSDDIVSIRRYLGLPDYRFEDKFHITVGNTK